MQEKKYCYIDAVVEDSEIIVWCRNEDGELFTMRYPITDWSFCYHLSNDSNATSFKDLHNRPLRRVDFPTPFHMKQWVDGKENISYSEISPQYKVLIEEFINTKPLIDYDAPVNYLLYDIETDFNLRDGNGYPLPENPHGMVNLIQAWHSVHKCYHVITMIEGIELVDLDEGNEVKVHVVSNEEEMLLAFAELLHDVDFFAGWFTNGYDMPYIMERAKMLFGTDYALRMFSRNGIAASTRTFFDENGNERTEYGFAGRIHGDMQELYKKFIPKSRTSWSLDSVCEDDLNEIKLEYEGNLGDLYREDPQTFHEYGLRDAYLLKRLNDKHTFIELAITLARMSGIRFSDVTGSVKTIESGLIRYALDKGIMLPDRKHSDHANFAGAIVYDTVEGRHDWSFTIDLSGLYPSIINMLGLSPETVIGHLMGGFDDYIKVVTQSDEPVQLVIEGEYSSTELPAKEIYNILIAEGWVISAAGVIFNGEMGLLAEYVMSLGANRKIHQKRMKEASDPVEISREDRFQQVYKLYGNSVYGCIGNEFFVLFDVRLAASITLSAQIVSKHQASMLNDILCDMDAVA